MREIVILVLHLALIASSNVAGPNCIRCIPLFASVVFHVKSPPLYLKQSCHIHPSLAVLLATVPFSLALQLALNVVSTSEITHVLLPYQDLDAKNISAILLC
jgi:hypothetical protein